MPFRNNPATTRPLIEGNYYMIAVVAMILPGPYRVKAYRYALDAVPFAFALCGLAAAGGHLRTGWKALILIGVVVGLAGIYWAYRI
mgnify:CR=1 FL=1